MSKSKAIPSYTSDIIISSRVRFFQNGCYMYMLMNKLSQNRTAILAGRVLSAREGEEREEVKREGDGKMGGGVDQCTHFLWTSAMQQRIKVKCLSTTISKQRCRCAPN